MQKLSKLKNSFSLSDINFGGLSASVNWVGYFEKKHGFSLSLVDEAVSLFEGFFGSSNERVVILTALSFDDEREKDKEVIRRYRHIYEKMKSRRLLLPMTNEYESFRFGEAPLAASSLSLSLDYADFIDLSRLMMCYSGVIGYQCFYIDPSLSVAIYPHDDVGYGCIALNGNETVCREFLIHCSESDSFKVVLD
ncbi:hypothetical protein HG549_08735 [Pseudomonas sp. SK]|uniref:hypothetical protein n=1 Tax=Pseudomonas sp. SK TaxID=2729423 RepID=UPI001463E870|nr:hypothetical protein [Pseudomonas sp. SK]QJQ20018.1 hypothetical protein HG549_08735 [Pseudomonas sp. SK]